MPLGRNKANQAQMFWDDNQLSERIKSVQFDRLVTGSGFLWKGKLSEKQIKNAVERTMSNFTFNGIKMREVGDIVLRKVMDEDLRKTRKVDYIASSSMTIEYDHTDILGYVQMVAANSRKFDVEEIIHIPLTRLNGKVDGFTPVESLTYELILIWAIKENMLSFMRNGGSPNKLFILPEEVANSDNHNYLTNVLMDRGVMENRHGNLVLTGNITVEDLEPKLKDMEYKELALYVTSNIAYALRVPVSRIPYMIGSSQSKGDAGGLAESGYWSMIESDQRTIEMHLNSQLFRELGFTVRFKKRYKLDNIRETQSMNMRADAAVKFSNLLSSQGYKMKIPKIISLLSGNESDVSMNDVEEMSDDEKMEKQNSNIGKSNLPDKEINSEEDKNKKNEDKKEAGKNNPSGSNQSGF